MKALRTIVFSLITVAASQAQNNVVLLNRGKMFVNDTLYVQGTLQAEGTSSIIQKGHTVITGDLINNATGAGHVFAASASDNTGTLEFAGAQPQTIKGNASKDANYINFPQRLIINNTSADGAVTLKADKSATAQNISVSNGRLVLDSEPVAGQRKSNHAHLLVEGTVTTGIQVNLAMGDNSLNGHLAGFSSPFETLYSDYFLFNFLTKPTNTGLFGDARQLITYPRTRLEPGMGYIVGMGIIPAGDPYYTSTLDPRFADADPTKKATTMFRFYRPKAEPTFTKYLDENNAPGSYSQEKLNTGDVRVSLRPGFNYIGNPYTAPLNLADIVQQTNMNEWGVTAGALKSGFYVLEVGTGTTADKENFTFTASYLKKQAIGSTYSDDVVAPMQMFIVGTDQAQTLTIPKSRRVHQTISYLRSTSAKPVDELLIETADAVTKGFDRLCIVFRPDASTNATDAYDAPKIFNASGGVNQIYTRSTDNVKLSSNIIPTCTREIIMYFEPSNTAQTVELKAERLESISSLSSITLEDAKTGAVTNLLQNPRYSFISSPSDRPDRFILRFSQTVTGIEAVETTGASVTYAAGTLTVQGLTPAAIGSAATIYNAAGQMLHSSPVNEIMPFRIEKTLGKGVYILKIQTRSYKFVVL
jgi:hypothetical protein